MPETSSDSTTVSYPVILDNLMVMQRVGLIRYVLVTIMLLRLPLLSPQTSRDVRTLESQIPMICYMCNICTQSENCLLEVV